MEKATDASKRKIIKKTMGLVKENFNRHLKYIWLGTVVALGVTSVYFYTQFSSVKKNPNKTTLEENQKLVAQIGALVVLPEGETPTIATVTNPEALKEQPFFANAKKGDKVLIYPTAKKAVLYSILNNKVVEIAPLTIGNSVQPSPAELPNSGLSDLK